MINNDTPVDRSPAEHLTHFVCPRSGCAVPFGHGKHVSVPACGENVPSKHSLQASPLLSSPRSKLPFLNHPARQGLHFPSDVLACPRLHAHLRLTASSSVPFSKPMLSSPAKHLVHFVSIPPLLTSFFGQSSHLFLPRL